MELKMHDKVIVNGRLANIVEEFRPGVFIVDYDEHFDDEGCFIGGDNADSPDFVTLDKITHKAVPMATKPKNKKIVVKGKQTAIAN